MDKPFLILLLSNSPPLTSGPQPSGRGQQTQLGQQPIIPTPSGVGSESIISRFFPSDRVGAGRGQNVDYS